MNKKKGFSLFELLITLVLISIVTMIALPSYTNHIAHGHRIEAEITLEKLAANLEQYNTLNNTYKDATLQFFNIPNQLKNNTYQITISNATDTEFLLTATPSYEQSKKDTLCGTLTLNSDGEKGITGQGKLTDCW